MRGFSFHTFLLRSTEINYLNKPLSRLKKQMNAREIIRITKY